MSYADITVIDEWSFELRSQDQMILHIGHTIPDREHQLAAAWPWEDKYPIHDRIRLAALLEEVDIRGVSADPIASKMPLPGERFFGLMRNISSDPITN
jgi:hypothetical protein